MEAAEPLAAEDAHPLSRELAAAAAAYATLERGEEADAFVAGLPLLAPIEARWMATGLMPPEVRQR